ncbi:trmB, partial [Symbiodinium pilosum]
MARLLVLPQDSSAGAVSGEMLFEELRRSFGLSQCADKQKEAKLLQHFCSIAENGGQRLNLSAAFANDKPLKVELCSGEGEWVCAQAAADAGRASWACVENRRDRVFRTFSRALLTGVSPNLCVVSADAAVFLRMLEAGSVAHVYVNFPEPPVRRGLGDADAEGANGSETGDAVAAPHLLTAETFRSVRRVLSSGGKLLIHSDNVTYLRQLAACLGAVDGFADVDPGPGAVRDSASGSNPDLVTVWRGRPGVEAGVPDPE